MLEDQPRPEAEDEGHYVEATLGDRALGAPGCSFLCERKVETPVH